MREMSLVWGVFGVLAVVYVVGFLLGWGERAPWHLLLVVVAIVGLFGVFRQRTK